MCAFAPFQTGGEYDGVCPKGRRGGPVTNREKHHIAIDRNCNATTPADTTPALGKFYLILSFVIIIYIELLYFFKLPIPFSLHVIV